MKILFTKTFYNYIDKYRIDKNVLIKEYIKIKNSKSCLKLGTYKDFIICKLYIYGKEKRLITLLEKDNFVIPIIIIKKETKSGYNIRKENIQELFKNDFIKVINDLEKGDIKEIVEI